MQLFDIIQKLDEGRYDPCLFKAIFVAGPPGAGKNSVLNLLGLPAMGLKLLDTDQTLAYLNAKRAPENKLNYDRAGYENPALDTTLRKMQLLKRNMLGLLINTTGRQASQLMKLNRELKSSGYDTFMLFVKVDKDIAWKRSQDREQHATNPSDKRKVDLPYFQQAYPQSMENFEFYEYMFDEQFASVTNNDEYVISEDISPRKLLDVTFRIAHKKINHFLQKPLSAIARNLIRQNNQSSS